MKESHENIKNLSKIIAKAKGERNLTEYSKDSGVSISHISRIINGKLKVVPSEEVLYRLTDSHRAKPRGGVTYNDALIAAGYEVEIDHEISDADLEKHTLPNFRIQEAFIILSYLSAKKVPITLDILQDMRENANDLHAFSIELDEKHFGIKEWCFFLLYKDKEENYEEENLKIMGQLLFARNKLENNTKVTIVTNSKMDFDFFTHNEKEVPFRGNLSIMLIDLYNSVIQEEKYISHFDNSAINKDFFIGDD